MDKFVGVQLGSHSVFDEGADHCLDILQEHGGINAIFVYSHMHHRGFATNRSLDSLAHDHGVAVRDPTTRNLTNVWVTPHDQYYAGTVIRHTRFPAQEEYADRDILVEVMEPARKRGMQVFARILEGFGPDLPALMPNWPKALTVDVYGRINHLPCWSNPNYINWWLGTVEDLFKSYPLDGFKYGSERSGPLSNLMMGAWDAGMRGLVPTCFCEHCQARGSARGIDPDRARRGLRELYEFIAGIVGGESPPADGVLVTILRSLLKYPEILAWEYQWHVAKEELAKLMYGAIKAIKPEAQIGWHIYHRGTTWDAIYRAEMDYAELVHYSDWLKPVVYHDVAGPRIRRDVARMHVASLSEISEPRILEVIYDTMGYDKGVEPTWDELTARGLSPDYVYRETKRCVEGVGDRIPIYPGIGFDIPHDRGRFAGDPETLYQATVKAFEAGARGLIVCREYDEMRLENLQAIKRALRDA